MRNLLVAAIALAACSKSPALPEADPAKAGELATTLLENVPLPAQIRECKYEEMVGSHATLTKRTLLELAKRPISKLPEVAEYVNPAELDSPAARQLIDATDEKLRRQAAAELLAAPSYLVYHVDLVDTPIPLGVKDFKRGHVGARAMKYDKAGKPVCQLVFLWTNHPEKQAWAIEKSDKPLIDPAVQQEMQKDLRAQMLVRVAGLGAPPPKSNAPADDRHDRN